MDMTDLKSTWKNIVARAIGAHMAGCGIPGTPPGPGSVVLEKPPRSELGDFGFPMFPFAKLLRSSPVQLAKSIGLIIASDPEAASFGTALAEGPYLNIKLARTPFISDLMAEISSGTWGKTDSQAGRRVMVEFSCPNTNKPLHLGHLRNNILGESISRILAAAGADVRKVNLINDRGVHICKSMLAYMRYGKGRTPEDEGLKSDHFVGKYYVLFNKLKEEDPEAENKAQELLRRWEAGDADVIDLWKKMNLWAVEGIKATYVRQGISFDSYYYESETYSRGRGEVLKGLESGIFYKDEDGSVWVNLEDIGLDRKVLLRRDGTSLYITQDIGTAIYRHDDWPFDRLVYVVAS
ncbi:MAG: arginine--tRNA ligase, partial [Rectinemataceae bacterium]|nr:arginine--tRNA ligase [Rectinemataceae bacterium]